MLYKEESFFMKKFKIVEVEWVDAQSSLDAVSLEDLENHPPAITKSCGYLVAENKERIILSFMIFNQTELDKDIFLKHYQYIPKGMIKKITELK